VHGPVGATGFGEFTGTVKGVHDPHPLGGQPRRIVAYPLFGQHRVARAPALERRGDQIVGVLVADRAQRGRIGVPVLRAQVAQQRAGLLGQPAGERAVDRRRHQ